MAAAASGYDFAAAREKLEQASAFFPIDNCDIPAKYADLPVLFLVCCSDLAK